MKGFKERLKDAMDIAGMSNYKLAKAAGLSASTIANWLSGTTTPDSTKLELVSLHLNCNADWLLTGNGFMISKRKELYCKTEEELITQLRISIANNIIENKILLKEIEAHFGIDKSSVKDLIYDFDSILGIDIPLLEDILEFTERKEEQTRPRIPLTAAAGSLSGVTDSVTIKDCEQFPIIHQFPSYDFTMFIKGDSMSPKYESGDEIACRKIDQNRFVQWGKPHVLDTTQGIIVKRIYEDNNKIRCVSYNNDYKDFSIPKEDIYSISLVVGVLSISEV